MRVLLTGGAGFIGSAVWRRLTADPANRVVVLDKLTYSGNLVSLSTPRKDKSFRFVHGDICDEDLVLDILRDEHIDHVMHLAAETHVDRSIDGPAAFLHTNVIGTFTLLQASLRHWRSLSARDQDRFRFHHISTDEVFGDLPLDESLFREDSPYAPSSPYSASKAASDHLVRAWHRTYALPVVLSNCSNNYGPFQFPEKLVPLSIINGLEQRPIRVYGDGSNVRDWLHVDDHARALEMVCRHGAIGESYNIGGRAECSNLSLVHTLCDMLDQKRPRVSRASYRDLITFVGDRPGHDRRYAISTDKIERDLGWTPGRTLAAGIEDTIDWYLANEWWWQPLRQRSYAGQRLGKLEGAT